MASFMSDFRFPWSKIDFSNCVDCVDQICCSDDKCIILGQFLEDSIHNAFHSDMQSTNNNDNNAQMDKAASSPPTTTETAAMATTPSSYSLLVEFAYRHMDFQMAELESVLLMNDIILGTHCHIQPLINENIFEETLDEFFKEGTIKQLTGAVRRRPFVLLSFAMDWWNAGSANQNEEDKGEAIASMILSRCALVRSVCELWAMAPTLDECADRVKEWTETTDVGRTTLQRVADSSWKLTVHTLGTKYTVKEQNDMRAHFQFLNALGPVKLKGKVVVDTICIISSFSRLAGTKTQRS